MRIIKNENGKNSAAGLPDRSPAEVVSQFEPDEVSAGLLAAIGAFSVVVLALIVILLQAWFYDWKGDLTAVNYMATSDPQTPLGSALVEQQAHINNYHWINRETGIRAIPIERAMELVALEMSARENKLKKSVKPNKTNGQDQL